MYGDNYKTSNIHKTVYFIQYRSYVIIRNVLSSDERLTIKTSMGEK